MQLTASKGQIILWATGKATSIFLELIEIKIVEWNSSKDLAGLLVTFYFLKHLIAV